MKDEEITRIITFKCTYEEGDCKYKNPANIKGCIGCYFARVIKNVMKEK